MRNKILFVTLGIVLLVCLRAFAINDVDFSASEVRKTISSAITGIEYDNRLGIFRMTSGYCIAKCNGEARGSTGAFTGDKTVAHGLSADPNVIVQSPDVNVTIKMVAHDVNNVTFRALDHNDINTSTSNASWIAWK